MEYKSNAGMLGLGFGTEEQNFRPGIGLGPETHGLGFGLIG